MGCFLVLSMMFLKLQVLHCILAKGLLSSLLCVGSRILRFVHIGGLGDCLIGCLLETRVLCFCNSFFAVSFTLVRVVDGL